MRCNYLLPNRTENPMSPALAKEYRLAKIIAQQESNRDGFDRGIEINGPWVHVFMLPRKKNRTGHELRCEVVSSEGVPQKGHGY